MQQKRLYSITSSAQAMLHVEGNVPGHGPENRQQVAAP
jgi:hypothetical protein